MGCVGRVGLALGWSVWAHDAMRDRGGLLFGFYVIRRSSFRFVGHCPYCIVIHTFFFTDRRNIYLPGS